MIQASSTGSASETLLSPGKMCFSEGEEACVTSHQFSANFPRIAGDTWYEKPGIFFYIGYSAVTIPLMKSLTLLCLAFHLP